jgi:hypothetical protein
MRSVGCQYPSKNRVQQVVELVKGFLKSISGQQKRARKQERNIGISEYRNIGISEYRISGGWNTFKSASFLYCCISVTEGSLSKVVANFCKS